MIPTYEVYETPAGQSVNEQAHQVTVTTRRRLIGFVETWTSKGVRPKRPQKPKRNKRG